MTDRTFDAVKDQVNAMATRVFEVGLCKPASGGTAMRREMLPRTWNTDTLMKSIAWLKFQNRDGRNIYIRPQGEHALSLIDDLTPEALQRMRSSGFAPAVIVETSPANFQVWLNHGRVLPKELSSAVARELASRFGGDTGSADWRHFGRLAGFTNRKEKHRQPDGLFPFVRLVHASGAIYEKADEFIATVNASLEAALTAAAERQRRFAANSGSRKAPLKTISDFRQDSKYGGDGHRIDLAYAVYALSHGVSEHQVCAAIGTRDLNHKGSPARQTDYIERTVAKAMRMIRRDGLTR